MDQWTNLWGEWTTLSDGVAVKTVLRASEVASIICKWVIANLHTIECLRSIAKPGPDVGGAA